MAEEEAKIEKTTPEEGQSGTPVNDNIARLRELFPEAFTEGKVDFDTLRQLLGDMEVLDEGEEKYGLHWHGKKKARQTALTPSMATLRPCPEESVDWETTQNLFIEGDNLEVLKLLQRSYANRVKMIYIDPPYNTGNEFIYPDRFQENLDTYLRYTGQRGENGEKFTTNNETSGRRHTNWLNMMYPRLKLAKNLLQEDGVIFISIDDHEQPRLREVCDEIFGEENFVISIIWKKRNGPPNDKVIGGVHEYVLMYSKDISRLNIYRKERSEEQLSRYSNPDNHPKGLWTSGDLMANVKGGRYVESLHFPIINPRTGREHYPSSGGNWRFNKQRIQELLANDEIYFGKNDDGRPKLKRFLSEVNEGVAYSSLWDDIAYNNKGTSEIADLLGNLNIFDTTKPTELIIESMKLGTTNNDLVLDFFAGSATVADATYKVNVEQKTHRRYICVQLPEITSEKSTAKKEGYQTIADIGKERIRRAAAKIKEEHPDYKGDLGFKVFKLDASNIKVWQTSPETIKDDLFKYEKNILSDRTEQDILYELLLKRGVDLCTPITTKTVAGKTLHSIGYGKIIACLSEKIDQSDAEPLAMAIADWQDELKAELGLDHLETHVFFRDAAFGGNDVTKTNLAAILAQRGITHMRSL